MNSINLRDPHESIRRVYKVERVVRKEPPIERTGHCCNETRPKLVLMFFIKLLVEAWQWPEHRIEIVSGKVIQECLERWRGTVQLSKRVLDVVYDVWYHQKGIGSRRASQVSYLQTVWEERAAELFYARVHYGLHSRNYCSLKQIKTAQAMLTNL